MRVAEGQTVAMFDFVWRRFASVGLGACLSFALAAIVLASALIPQGWLAVEQLGAQPSETLRWAYRLGLADVSHAPLFWGLVALCAGNFAAMVLVRSFGSRGDVEGTKAPLQGQLESAKPEQAPLQTRQLLAAVLGPPIKEVVEGPSVRLLFETAPRARWMGLTLHAGLVLLMVGAVLASSPPNKTDMVVKATLVAKDAKSNALGYFDLAQREERNFFFHPDVYVLRGYEANALGLGPAVIMQRFDPRTGQSGRFRVFQDAPPGFDAKHRRGQVGLTAVSMGYAARPGFGLTSRGEAVLALIGFALLLVAAMEVGRPQGFVEANILGRTVSLKGWFQPGDQRRFQTLFAGLSALLEQNLRLQR